MTESKAAEINRLEREFDRLDHTGQPTAHITQRLQELQRTATSNAPKSSAVASENGTDLSQGTPESFSSEESANSKFRQTSFEPPVSSDTRSDTPGPSTQYLSPDELSRRIQELRKSRDSSRKDMPTSKE